MRDLVASTDKTTILVMFMSAGGFDGPGDRMPGAFVREAVWVGGLGNHDTQCNLGKYMQPLPAMPAYPGGFRVAVGRPCDAIGSQWGSIEVAVIEVQPESADGLDDTRYSARMPGQLQLLGWRANSHRFAANLEATQPANAPFKRAIFFASTLPVFSGSNATLPNYGNLSNNSIGFGDGSLDSLPRPGFVSLSAVAIGFRDNRLIS